MLFSRLKPLQNISAMPPNNRANCIFQYCHKIFKWKYYIILVIHQLSALYIQCAAKKVPVCMKEHQHNIHLQFQNFRKKLLACILSVPVKLTWRFAKVLVRIDLIVDRAIFSFQHYLPKVNLKRFNSLNSARVVILSSLCNPCIFLQHNSVNFIFSLPPHLLLSFLKCGSSFLDESLCLFYIYPNKLYYIR